MIEENVTEKVGVGLEMKKPCRTKKFVYRNED